eukprot:g1017.t1
MVLKVLRFQEDRLLFLRKYYCFTVAEYENLRFLFNRSDKEGNGTLKRQELARLVEALFPNQAHMPQFRPVLATRPLKSEPALGSGLSGGGMPVLPQHKAEWIQFSDEDPRKGFVKGMIQVGPAANESDISHYYIFWASNKRLLNLIICLPKGIYEHHLGEGQEGVPIPPGANQLVVKTSNAAGMMEAGVSTSVKLLKDSEKNISVDLMALLAVTRKIKDETEIYQCSVYAAALRDMGFQTREAAEFLSIFLPVTDEGAQPLICEDLVNLFTRSCQSLYSIFKQVLAEDKGVMVTSSAGPPREGLDFLGFMLLMRRVIDAGIGNNWPQRASN